MEVQDAVAEAAPFEFGVVDAWVNLMSQERTRHWEREMAAIDRMFHRTGADLTKSYTPAQLVESMDAGGIATAFLTASTYPAGQIDVVEDLVELAGHLGRVVEAFPTRFVSVPLIAPRRGLDLIRAMGPAVRDHGVRGFHVFPVLTQQSASDPLMYPLYAEAAELGVPMVINVGMPGPAGYAELQHPSHIDRICTDFPELRVVAAHVGAPWQAEVIWYMGKHENLTLMTSAFAPRRYPAEVLDYMKTSRGRHRVMFATDYPIIQFRRAMAEIRDMGLDPQTARAFLRDNALRVFGVEGVSDGATAEVGSALPRT